MAQVIHIDRVSYDELWRLAFRFMAEVEAEASLTSTSDRTTWPLRRLRQVMLEIRQRGVQMSFDRSGDE